MNREIKFRVYDSEKKAMFYCGNPFEAYYTTDDDGVHFGDFVFFGDVESKYNKPYPWKFMQYTGLKDKNGKEIYEGDIIKECDDMVMLVSWSEKYASFCLDKKGWMFSHYFSEAINPDESEVIGNIYQNPDLLK